MMINRWLERASVVGALATKQEGVARAQVWSLSALAAQVVGRYERGATLRFSERVGRKIDTVEQMAGGYVTFSALWRCDARRAWRARLRYSYRRFYELGGRMARYDLTAEQAFELLESELNNVAMALQADDMHSPRPEWHRRFVGSAKSWLKLVDDDAPADVKAWATVGKNLIDKYGGTL